MSNSVVSSLAALLSLIPVTVLSYRRETERPDMAFWILIAVAFTVPALYAATLVGGTWKTGLSVTLWVSIAASMAIFVVLIAVSRETWRLTPLLLPYLVLLGLIATIWTNLPQDDGLAAAPDAWLALHILVGLGTYALCTLAAVAGLAATLQERALKRKHPTDFTRRLPSVADASALQVGLLAVAEVVLALGIVTGMARQYEITGQVLAFDHKTLLSILAFAVIAALLFLHHRTGLRGQRAARFILVAYLLLTLAFPGVKFVTDVLTA
jgi:ABC-type uncharacterized transport system permease subunit